MSRSYYTSKRMCYIYGGTPMSNIRTRGPQRSTATLLGRYYRLL